MRKSGINHPLKRNKMSYHHAESYCLCQCLNLANIRITWGSFLKPLLPSFQPGSITSYLDIDSGPQ